MKPIPIGSIDLYSCPPDYPGLFMMGGEEGTSGAVCVATRDILPGWQRQGCSAFPHDCSFKLIIHSVEIGFYMSMRKGGTNLIVSPSSLALPKDSLPSLSLYSKLLNAISSAVDSQHLTGRKASE